MYICIYKYETVRVYIHSIQSPTKTYRERICVMVVLPAPEGPTMLVTVPGWSLRLMPLWMMVIGIVSRQARSHDRIHNMCYLSTGTSGRMG
jgi:hypothetical protein